MGLEIIIRGPGGEIGKRCGLRSRWTYPWEFESPPGHH